MKMIYFFLSFLLVSSLFAESGPAVVPQVEEMILLYKISEDTECPSSFIVEYPGGLSLKLVIVWGLSEKEKKEIDKTVQKLEKIKLNGARFKCKGEWIKRGYKLKVLYLEPLFNIDQL